MNPSSVLVVDDDQTLVDTLAIWLEHEGFEVHRAYNGLQGLATAKRASPDLVLTDIAMPGMNGVQLAARLREQDVPVVLLSATEAPPDMLPDTPFLSKPFDIEEMYQLLIKTLDEHVGRAFHSHEH